MVAINRTDEFFSIASSLPIPSLENNAIASNRNRERDPSRSSKNGMGNSRSILKEFHLATSEVSQDILGTSQKLSKLTTLIKKNENGRTPLTLALQYCHDDVYDLLDRYEVKETNYSTDKSLFERLPRPSYTPSIVNEEPNSKSTTNNNLRIMGNGSGHLPPPQPRGPPQFHTSNSGDIPGMGMKSTTRNNNKT